MIIRIIVFSAFSLFVGSFLASYWDFVFSINTTQVLFTVAGIVYSILISKIIGFSLDDILNPNYRKHFKDILEQNAKISTCEFFLVVVLLLCIDVDLDVFSWEINFINTSTIFSTIFIMHTTFLFLGLYKLSIEVSDRLVEEKKKVI